MLAAYRRCQRIVAGLRLNGRLHKRRRQVSLRLAKDDLRETELIGDPIESAVSPLGQRGQEIAVQTRSAQDRGDADSIVGHFACDGFKRSIFDAAVGQQQYVPRARVDVSQRECGLLDRRKDHGSTAGVEAIERPVQRQRICGRLNRRGPSLVAVELENADFVVRLQPAQRQAAPLPWPGQFSYRSLSRRCR